MTVEYIDAKPKLKGILTIACSGTGIAPQAFFSILSQEDIDDIQNDLIPLETVKNYARAVAQGVKEGRYCLQFNRLRFDEDGPQ